MRRFEFPADVMVEIDRDRYGHPDPAVQRRMEALWLKAHGHKHAAIVELSGLSRPTLQRLLDKYGSGGLAEARAFHWHGSAASPLEAHRVDLGTEFKERPPHTVAEACDRVERLTGVRLGPSRVRRFLRERLDLRWRKVAAVPLPPGQTVAEHAATQAAFLKGLLESEWVISGAKDRFGVHFHGRLCSVQPRWNRARFGDGHFPASAAAG